MNKYMEIAIKEAKKAEKHNDVPIGAVIVKNNKIISKGHNKKELTKMVTKHAEIVAIERACKKLHSWRLDDCEIYITMEPCKMCYNAILQSRIKKIYYSVNNEKFGNFSNKNNNDKIKIETGLYKEQCQKIVHNFFLEKRK